MVDLLKDLENDFHLPFTFVYFGLRIKPVWLVGSSSSSTRFQWFVCNFRITKPNTEKNVKIHKAIYLFIYIYFDHKFNPNWFIK